jgi:hypothetical protein
LSGDTPQLSVPPAPSHRAAHCRDSDQPIRERGGAATRLRETLSPDAQRIKRAKSDGYTAPQKVTDMLHHASDIIAVKAAPDEAKAYRDHVFRVADKTAEASKEQSGELVFVDGLFGGAAVTPQDIPILLVGPITDGGGAAFA